MNEPVRVSMVERGCRPWAYLRSVAGRPCPALLESSLARGPLGRYSILCWEPFRKLTCRRDGVTVEDMVSGGVTRRTGNPFAVLSEEFAPWRLDLPADFPLPFAGGAVCCFSYDLRHRVEKLPRLCSYDLDVPEFVVCFHDRALVFDHAQDTTWFVGPPGARPPRPAPDGPRTASAQLPPPAAGCRLTSNFTPPAYMDAVQRVREYIAAGDIFQANLSQRFEGPCPLDGLSVYERLRAVNPAPFAAYLRQPGFEVICSSPERFLLLEGDLVTTRPIKGTRPRREGDEAFNRRMREALLASRKDLAELAMIVDLERNDLGRVCRYGTVRVVEHAALETYPTVFHLVSTIQGRLYRERHDEFSLLRAAFPGGSITGAPKIRAMEIIEELEPHARSIYTGSIGYISFHGRVDLNIVIRTILRAGDRAWLQVGGGIVADSEPEFELRETLHKGKALFQALGAENYEEIMEPCRRDE